MPEGCGVRFALLTCANGLSGKVASGEFKRGKGHAVLITKSVAPLAGADLNQILPLVSQAWRHLAAKLVHRSEWQREPPYPYEVSSAVGRYGSGKESEGTHFLVHTCVNRLAGDGNRTISREMKHAPIQDLQRIAIRDKRGKVSNAVLEIRYRRLLVHPPIGKQKNYPQLVLTIIYVRERGQPQGRERIDWKLLTDSPVR